MSSFVSVKFTNTPDNRAKSNQSIAGAFGKSENPASEEAVTSAEPLTDKAQSDTLLT
jgi:hypothetical protein